MKTHIYDGQIECRMVYVRMYDDMHVTVGGLKKVKKSVCFGTKSVLKATTANMYEMIIHFKIEYISFQG